LSFTDDSSQFHRIVRTHDSSGRIRQLARWIHADKQAGTPEIQAEQRLLLQALVAEFRRSLRQPEHPLVRAVRQYIQDHIAEPLSLARLARQTRQSKYHFLRKYKKLAGRTPIQDARGIRINFAKELILSTDLPLKEIAARAGLGNEYTLSRTFRRHFKIPPGELRRTHCLRS
jgi:transcriptional regulator GlxA family with amidase domain